MYYIKLYEGFWGNVCLGFGMGVMEYIKRKIMRLLR